MFICHGYSRLAILVISALLVDCGSGDAGEPEIQPLSEREYALANIFSTPPTTPFAGLGRGRDAITEELRDFCIASTGTLMDYSSTNSRLFVDSAMSKTEIKESVELSVSASAGSEKIPMAASSEFNFKLKLEENDYSIVMVYGAEYIVGGRTLDPLTRRMLVMPSDPNWHARCGDHFLMQTEMGGQLFAVVRIEFDSISTKLDFSAKLGAKAAFTEVKKTLDANLSLYAGRATIHVEAFQKGGNVAAIGEVLGAAGAVDCGLGDMAKCDALITKALAYAGSPNFIAGMNEKPADLRYYWASWKTVLGAAGPADRTIPAELIQARKDLHGKALEQIALRDRARTVKAAISAGQIKATETFRAQLPNLEAAIVRNLELLGAASAACFDELNDPITPADVSRCVTEASSPTLLSKGYDPSITLARLEPSNGRVVGNVDGIAAENGDWWLGGWACVRGDSRSIDVIVSGQSGVLASARAALASEPDISTQCNSSGAAYRFKIPLNSLVLDYPGEPIRVTGVSSQPGAQNEDLTAPESLAIPKVWMPRPPSQCGRLGVDEGLLVGQSIQSCDGTMSLTLHSDGNVVLHLDLFGVSTPLWSLGTQETGASVLRVQDDGNLVLRTDDGRVVWASGTWNRPGAVLNIQDFGIGIQFSGGATVWAANTAAPRTMRLSVSSVGGDSIRVEWSSPPGILGEYVIGRRVGERYSKVGTAGSYATGFDESGVPPFAVYTYRVWVPLEDEPFYAYSQEVSAVTGTTVACMTAIVGGI